VCALNLEFTANIYILAIYRAPSGNFISFLNEIDKTINSLYKESKFIICGDINIDYQMDNDKRKQLDAVLQTYNLTSIVHFPNRIQNQSSTTIDNIRRGPKINRNRPIVRACFVVTSCAARWC
jgi:exonuclease III